LWTETQILGLMPGKIGALAAMIEASAHAQTRQMPVGTECYIVSMADRQNKFREPSDVGDMRRESLRQHDIAPLSVHRVTRSHDDGIVAFTSLNFVAESDTPGVVEIPGVQPTEVVVSPLVITEIACRQ
jgi:hypothetical protein